MAEYFDIEQLLKSANDLFIFKTRKMKKPALYKLDKKSRETLKNISDAIKGNAKYKYALHGYLDALYDLKIINLSEWYELYGYYARGNE